VDGDTLCSGCVFASVPVHLAAFTGAIPSWLWATSNTVYQLRMKSDPKRASVEEAVSMIHPGQ